VRPPTTTPVTAVVTLPPALEFVVDRLGVSSRDLVVDLGCGTGQLAIPLAERVRHVLGIDPEPDMLAHARQAARACGVPGSTSWLLGSDADVPTLPRLLGDGAIAALTISNAVHLMDTRTLFPALAGLLTPGSTVAVIANGSPTPPPAHVTGPSWRWTSA
jgi:ubiquinone/menaquinone biosynthesis C-methylase UbiE